MPFDADTFARALLAEALFYDAEFGASGSVSLIDPETGRERYIAGYDAGEAAYLIEEAVSWDDEDAEDIGYLLADDTRDQGRFDTNTEAADALFDLARRHALLPSFLPEFEDAP